MALYVMREEDKQFLTSLLYATGIILFWRGIWDMSIKIPLLKTPLFCAAVGLAIITLTGYLYREYDPISNRMHKIGRVLHDVINQAKKGEPHEIFYYDQVGKHHHKVLPHKIKKIEHDYIIVEEKGHEVFIPMHRITHVHKQGKAIWRR
jgi:uncharacterized protein (UPF0248 family)